MSLTSLNLSNCGVCLPPCPVSNNMQLLEGRCQVWNVSQRKDDDISTLFLVLIATKSPCVQSAKASESVASHTQSQSEPFVFTTFINGCLKWCALQQIMFQWLILRAQLTEDYTVCFVFYLYFFLNLDFGCIPINFLHLLSKISRSTLDVDLQCACILASPSSTAITANLKCVSIKYTALNTGTVLCEANY